MRRPRSSVYLLGETPNPEAVATAWAWVRAAVQQAPGAKALLAVRAKSQLKRILTGLLPVAQIQEFTQRARLPLPGLWLQLLTLHSGRISWDGPVLVVDPSVTLLNRVDDLEGVPAVGVLSWNWEKVRGWVARWHAGVLDVHHPLPAPQWPAFSNPVLEAELQRLTRQVNLLTGIIHPNDRAMARACFTELCERQIEFDGLEVEQWLITCGGWQVEDAADVRRVAEAAQRADAASEAEAIHAGANLFA